MTEMMVLARRVDELVRARGIRIVSWCEALGTDRATWSRWRTGAQSPTGPIGVLLRLIDADPTLIGRTMELYAQEVGNE